MWPEQEVIGWSRIVAILSFGAVEFRFVCTRLEVTLDPLIVQYRNGREHLARFGVPFTLREAHAIMPN